MTAAARRRLALAALLLAALVTYLVVKPPSGHTLHLRFMDAGQLVTGDSIDVAGRPIGSITALRLAEDGTADIVARIDDDAWPVRLGTQAQIRLRSLPGLANRYVDLTPGRRDAPALPDGGTIDLESTQGVVDLDEILDDFGPRVRRNLQDTIAGFARAGRGAARAGAEDLRLAPAALTAADRFTAQLTDDPPALSGLLRSGAVVAGRLADHQLAISHGIVATQEWVSEVNRSRADLAAVLTEAPPVMTHIDATLTRARASLHDPIRPALRALAPSAQPLAAVLRRLPRTATRTVTTLRAVRGLLPALDATFRRLPALARTGIPAVRAATAALRGSGPIFAGLREYAPDLIAGQFGGLAAVSGYYDANGHYARVPVQTSRIGIPATSAAIEPINGPVETALGIDGLRAGLVAACPGGAEGPADDHSNPWIENAALCDPRDDFK